MTGSSATVQHGIDGWQVFYEVATDGFTDWMQIWPKPGQYKHPVYGDVVITDARLQRLAASFADRIYQEHIPVDAEHATKISGALGYYREVEARSDGLFARIELSERGKSMLDEGRFRYFSAEVHPNWIDPMGVSHGDTLIGGAFTTKPFFKDRQQMPILASEMTFCEGMSDYQTRDAANSFVRVATDLLWSGAASSEQLVERLAAACEYVNKWRSVETKSADTIEFSEESQMPNTESDPKAGEKDPPQDFSDRIAKLDVENVALRDQIAKLEFANRDQRFREAVTGRGGISDGAQWFGEPEANLKLMHAMADQFGETSEVFTAFVADKRAVAVAMKAATSQSFSELGQTGAASGAGGAEHPFLALAKAKQVAGLTRGDAIKAAAAEYPQAYAEYSAGVNGTSSSKHR